MIKGECCFVYLENTDLSPLYGFSLSEVYPLVENPKNPDKCSVTVNPAKNTNETHHDMVTILLKYKSSGKQAYQFTFETDEDKSIATRFFDIVERNGGKTDAAAATSLEKDVDGKSKK